MEDTEAQHTVDQTTGQAILRRGRGSMAGQIVAAKDWDSLDINEQLTGDFDSSP